VRDLIGPKDLTRGRTDVPVRFQIEMGISGSVYEYTIAFALPEGLKEPRVSEERLTVDTRELAQVNLARTGQEQEAKVRIDWHLVALPIIQEQSPNDPLYIFRSQLALMLILRPVPSLIGGDSEEETPWTNPQSHRFWPLALWLVDSRAGHLWPKGEVSQAGHAGPERHSESPRRQGHS